MKTKPGEKNVWHQLHGDEVLRLLEVDPVIGLTAEEVLQRQQKFGLNRLTPRSRVTVWAGLARQIHQPLVYLLLVAAGVTAMLGEWVDTWVILCVVTINAIVGFVQESKATTAIEALSRMIKTIVTARRGGQPVRVPADEVVPGDVVLLEAGDRVGADLRLLRVRNLQIDESALTGESVPALKDPDPLAPDTLLADRRNLAFAGTLVTNGHGEGVVWATGDCTETGRIAWLIAGAVELSTPLTRKIASLSRLLLWLILALAAATFALGLGRGEPAVDTFMAAVALAVGAIPEGLPAAVTIVLAIGVSRMARRGAVIRKLPAVETLGSTTVICSDKTGTLTQNKMSVREVFAGDDLFGVTSDGFETRIDRQRGMAPIQIDHRPALRACLRAGVLCNDARLLRTAEEVQAHGDPTELALLIAGERGGLASADAHRLSPRIDGIPFDSAYMFRATLHHQGDARVIYKVGAVERVLEHCAFMLDRNGAKLVVDRMLIHKVTTGMAERGLRVLACAGRDVAAGQTKLEHADVAEGLTLLGLFGMMDPPRPEAVAAVKRCQEAGIAVKMITGDHLVTARVIAQQVGIKHHEAAITGRELETVSDEKLPALAAATAVFARVAPEQKLRLVRALQAQGHVVAMTGDGVNDAPALKQADIGIAMGIAGTEVAKSASDMVLTDDNFATIEAAVEEERSVFDNLRKFIVWNLPTNAGESAILLLAIVMGTALPVLPLQLLWLNLAETIILGLTLVFEPKEPGLMQRPPRDPGAPLLSFALLMRTGLVTLVMLIGAFWLFQWELARPGESPAQARTAVVNVIVFVELAYLFNCRSLHRPCLGEGFFGNRWLFAGTAAMLAAQMLFTYAPLMNQLFHTAPVGVESWLRIVAVAAATFVIVELEKWLRYGRKPAGAALPE